MEDVQPLDLLQHYWELRALGHEPLLHIQQPGDAFCFPDGWYHATVNLGPTLAIALKLHRKEVSFLLLFTDAILCGLRQSKSCLT